MADLDNENKLKTILEYSRLGTWEWNVQTGETDFDERWAEIAGYSLQELAPLSIETWERLVHPEDIKIPKELLQEHLTGKEPFLYDFEYRMKHRDGHWIWVHHRGKVVSWTEGGQPLLILGSHEDITDHKQTEQALLQSETRYRSVVENQTELISRFRSDGTLIWLNEHAAKYVNQTVEELTGLNYLDFLSPEEREKSLESLATITVDNPIAESTQQLQLPNGENRWLQWRTTV